MNPINETINQTINNSGIINSIANITQPIIAKTSLILGGIFGVYLILTIIRIIFEYRRVKLLKEIKYDLKQLNNHFKIKTYKNRPMLSHRIKNFIKKGKNGFQK
jgi:hypothetical protein